MFFDMAGWLTAEVAEQFAIAEGTTVISGNGTNKPTGMLNTTPVTTADDASPLRAATAYQYIESDLTPGTQGILPDVLIDTVYTLNSMYRAMGPIDRPSHDGRQHRASHDDARPPKWSYCAPNAAPVLPLAVLWWSPK